MKKLILVLVSALTGSVLTILLLGLPPVVRAGGGAPTCSSNSGDVNADGKLDLTDAVTILAHLFRGSPTELVPFCATPPAPSGLPATGQKACYSSDRDEEFPCDLTPCHGQDGFYATGCPPEGRFIDNGDGTVTDNCTGLMWQQNTADANGDGQLTYDDALLWCDALNYCEDLSFGGVEAWDDWRLPNVRELQSLIDYGRSDTAIDPVFGAVSDYHWSSTSYADDLSYAWQVDFYDGIADMDVKDETYHVRAVRSGS